MQFKAFFGDLFNSLQLTAYCASIVVCSDSSCMKTSNFLIGFTLVGICKTFGSGLSDSIL